MLNILGVSTKSNIIPLHWIYPIVDHYSDFRPMVFQKTLSHVSVFKSITKLLLDKGKLNDLNDKNAWQKYLILFSRECYHNHLSP